MTLHEQPETETAQPNVDRVRGETKSSTRTALQQWALRMTLATLILLASPDILSMLAFRQKNWQWPADISLSVLSMASVTLIAARLGRADLLKGIVRRAWPAWLLLFAAAMSVRWSVDRQATISHVWWMFVVAVFAVALATVRPLALTIDAVCLFGTGATMIGLWLSLTNESFRFGDSAMGLFGNRNGFGAMLSFTWPAVLMTCRGTPWRRAIGVFLVPLWVWAVLETGSRTSLASMTLVVVVIVAYAAWRFLGRAVPSRTVRAMGAGGSVALLSVSIAIALRVGALSWFTFDTTLNSRTAMWRGLRTAMIDHGALGFGSAAFWSGARGYLLVAQNASGLGRELATGHNGWMHEWVALGIMGPVLVTVLVIVVASRALHAIEWGSRGQGSFIALTGLALVVQNVTEAMVTHPRSISWILWVMLVALPGPRRRQREAGSPG